MSIARWSWHCHVMATAVQALTTCLDIATQLVVIPALFSASVRPSAVILTGTQAHAESEHARAEKASAEAWSLRTEVSESSQWSGHAQ
jgi:hypothetical protein